MKALFLLILLLIFSFCLAAPVLDRILTAPDGDITGLGFGEGYLWAVDQTSETVYKIDPVTGSVENSWVCSQTGSRFPTGLTYANNQIYVAAVSTSSGNDPYCYRYSSSGAYVTSFDLDC